MENHKSLNSKICGSTSESSHFMTGYFTRNKSLSSILSNSLTSNNSQYFTKSKQKLSSKMSQPSQLFRGTKKIEYLIKNEKKLLNDYRVWTEEEKKKINNLF